MARKLSLCLTLGSDTAKWSFPRGKRFKETKKTQEATYIPIKKWGRGRGTSFGLGRRSSVINKRDSPSPNHYTIHSIFFRNSSGGRISPLSKIRRRRVASPGPGSYNVPTSIGRGPRFSIRGRSRSVGRRESSPPPGWYNPNYSLVENRKHKNIRI